MIRSAVVGSEAVKIAELEEQLRILHGDSKETRKDVEKFRVEMKELREEISKNAVEFNKIVAENRQSIVDEITAVMSRMLGNKGKEVNLGDKDSNTIAGNPNLGIRVTGIPNIGEKDSNMGVGNGLLPIPREFVSGQNKEHGSTSSAADSGEVQKILPKIELATFEGSDPRGWIRKCIKYFEVYEVPKEKRVGIASLYLMEKADAWYYNWVRTEGNHSWEQFEEALCKRFGEQGLEDIVEEFMKMRQEGNVEDYQCKFEDLRVRMERVLPGLGEGYFLSGFIGGLKDEIRPMVRMFRPTTLAHAFEIARLQEQLLLYNGRPQLSYKPVFSTYESNHTYQPNQTQYHTPLTYKTSQLH